MGTIVINTNLTLDGVVEDPTGEEGFGRGGWFDQMGGSDRAAWAEVETAEAMGTAAILHGARRRQPALRRDHQPGAGPAGRCTCHRGRTRVPHLFG